MHFPRAAPRATLPPIFAYKCCKSTENPVGSWGLGDGGSRPRLNLHRGPRPRQKLTRKPKGGWTPAPSRHKFMVLVRFQHQPHAHSRAAECLRPEKHTLREGNRLRTTRLARPGESRCWLPPEQPRSRSGQGRPGGGRPGRTLQPQSGKATEPSSRAGKLESRATAPRIRNPVT